MQLFFLLHFSCSFFYSCTLLVQLLLQLHFFCSYFFAAFFLQLLFRCIFSCSFFFAAFFLAASFLGEGSLPGEAMSSSPAMNCAHSRLAEGQQNSRLRAQTLLTFSHSPCSFRWSLQGLLRKTLPQAETPPQKQLRRKLPKSSSAENRCFAE